MPSLVWSFRLTCVISTSLDGRDSGSTQKAMILRGNLHLAGQKILHRVIRAVMPEFQLERLPAEGQAAKLVTQADTKDRHTPRELANVFNSVGDRLGIAGAVREKTPLGRSASTSSAEVLAGTTVTFAIVIYK